MIAEALSTDAAPALPSILLVGPLPPPSGGMANQTEQLAALLAAEGCRVRIVQVNAPYRPAWIGRLRGLRALFRLLPYLLRLWRETRDVDLVHVMANSGWAWHLFAAPAVWIARLRATPAIVNYRGGEAEAFFARHFRFVRPTLERAAAVVVPSGFLRRVFDQRNVATEIVPNIVDLARFRPGVRRAGRVQVLVTRNLEDLYDIPTALRAFAKIRAVHPGATMSVAGSGPRLEALQALARQIGIGDAVAFTGRVPNERIAALYADADVLLNPSLVDNMPISLLEAMASAVPIVSTDVGGIPFLVEDGRTALLIPPGDADAMAGAALRVIGDPLLRERMGAAALDAVGRYAWPQVRGLPIRRPARPGSSPSVRSADIH